MHGQSKRSEIISIRVTPEERDRLLKIARWEDRNMSDSLHGIIFGRGGRGSQRIQGLLDKRRTA